ncbi:MAG: hypothetical protein ACYCPQ_05415 [Elusimicrobiota bacterium]
MPEIKPGAAVGPRILKTLTAALLFAAAFLSYSNSLKNGFCWDDHIIIENNPFIKNPENLKILADQVLLKPVTPIIGAARPIFLASLILDHAVWGEHALGYHLTSVVLHGINAVLVWILGGLFLSPFAAAVSGLIFAVHPVNTEAVNPASFRPDLLAAFFMLSALLAYRRMETAKKRWVAPALLLAAAAYALGVFYK